MDTHGRSYDGIHFRGSSGKIANTRSLIEILSSVGLATPVPRTSELEASLPGQGQGQRQRQGLGQGQGLRQDQAGSSRAGGRGAGPRGRGGSSQLVDALSVPNITLYNARSVWAKWSNLAEDINMRQTDLCMLTEIWEKKESKKHKKA